MLVSNDPRFEFINYHGNTSLFALEKLKHHGSLDRLKLLSISCLMPHLADYLAIFPVVHHATMAETSLPVARENLACDYTEHRGDFFDIPRLDIDCAISHATIHCFNDSRYGNARSLPGQGKPYQAPRKLREIAGNAVPSIVSVAVSHEEGGPDNNFHLSHERFMAAWKDAGWTCREFFFDYVCGGLPQKPEYLSLPFRRSQVIPDLPGDQWIVGNYYFA